MTIINDLDLDTLRLLEGAHSANSGEMCVMEAAAFIAGEPWSDHPVCASPVLGAFLRAWNDALDDETRQTLKPYARDVIGTAKGAAVDGELAWMATDWLVRVQTPTLLRLAGLVEQADTLANLTELQESAHDLVRRMIEHAKAA